MLSEFLGSVENLFRNQAIGICVNRGPPVNQRDKVLELRGENYR